MKTLKEGLLDTIDNTLEKGDTFIYLQELANKFNNASDMRGCDLYGRPLKIGDLVIATEGAYAPLPGVIIDMQNGKAVVSTYGDGSEYICNYGPNKGKMQILKSDYKLTFELLKIDDKILKQIYNLK